jgi:hypothetical protein
MGNGLNNKETKQPTRQEPYSFVTCCEKAAVNVPQSRRFATFPGA